MEETRDNGLEVVFAALAGIDVTVERDAGNGHGEDVVGLARLNAHKNRLAVDIAIFAIGTARALDLGVEDVEQEEAVAVAVPAPVEVEHAVAVIAVADEGMATRILAAAEDHGTSFRQFAVDGVGPLLRGVVNAAQGMGAALVVEVFGEIHRYLCGRGTR